ncbi:SnoaL-like domain-containing protein [Parafrankia irregularis]|uniref:SnoaL-like domain-containing protein n=1 Tax=Parafrankia irregularis TaxID=795642 RepID=A0A0S4QGH8_9ACTN|nr:MULTISPECIES: nuclear transport factor 2 family protein [Parafrankia]MBE3200945.1 nuclear transport factor 2 family protein [Parafrankia sp. CH37]CUU54656.1 SnoaL-like domain-containing protein [Parafrankia irregularis]
MTQVTEGPAGAGAGDLAATLADALTRLDRLESQDAIRKVKADYMQWCDDKRGRDLADLWWPDGIWEGVGPLAEGRWVGHEAIAAMFEASPKRLSFTVHYLTNESITVDGDHAVGRWKILEPATFGPDVAFWQGGRYENDFERRGGVWKMTHLRLWLDFRSTYETSWAAGPLTLPS